MDLVKKDNDVAHSPNKDELIEHGKDKLPYVEIELADGSLARQCRASADCSKRYAFIFKRLRMMAHLKDHHGIDIEIQKRVGGRPIHRETNKRADILPRPELKDWQKATKRRFGDKDKKFATNVQRTIRVKKIQALQAWEKLSQNHEALTKDQFVESFVAKEMEKYMANKAHKLEMIQGRIDRGYKANMQMIGTSVQPELAMKNLENLDSCQYVPTNHQIDGRKIGEEEPDYNVKELDKDSSINVMSLSNVNENLCPSRKKLPIRRAKLCAPISPIDLSLLEDTKFLSLRFRISSGQVEVERNDEDACLPSHTQSNVALNRLAMYKRIEFSSSYLGLLVDLDDTLLRAILSDEASSRTMNLFSMWMEHTLPSPSFEYVYIVDAMWFNVLQTRVSKLGFSTFAQNFFHRVDISDRVLSFFPVVLRSHWCMCVLCLNTHLQVVGLADNIHQILFYDPLELIHPMEVLPTLHSALESMAILASDVIVAHVLAEPASQICLKVLKGPIQPNSKDCGFYVMAAIRYLIVSCLQEKNEGWVTKSWFMHEDIIMLKQGLHEWLLDMLGRPEGTHVCWVYLCCDAPMFPFL